MAEPARKMPRRESREPDDEPSDVTLLQRYVERPGGRVELLEIPLTPEDFLNPRYGDKWLQGRTHSDVTHELTALLKRHFGARPDVVVMSDVQHRFGPGLDEPSPDVSVIQGVRDPRMIESSFDLQKVGVLPCLLVEVVSPRDSRIRHVDKETKVGLYQRVGIPEYLLVRPPRPEEKNQPFRLWGYRLASDRRYRSVEPDEKGWLLSETTGLWFAVSLAGDRIEVFDAKTRKRLRTLLEEVEAREAAEEELARLRVEIERLMGSVADHFFISDERYRPIQLVAMLSFASADGGYRNRILECLADGTSSSTFPPRAISNYCSGHKMSELFVPLAPYSRPLGTQPINSAPRGRINKYPARDWAGSFSGSVKLH